MPIIALCNFETNFNTQNTEPSKDESLGNSSIKSENVEILMEVPSSIPFLSLVSNIEMQLGVSSLDEDNPKGNNAATYPSKYIAELECRSCGVYTEL